MISRRERALNYAVLTVFAALALVPLVGVVASSLTPRSQSSPAFTWPHHLDWSNFSTAWAQGHFATYLRSSLLVAVSVVLITGVLAILAGYSFARFDYPGRSLLFYVTLVGLMVPPEAFVIPLYFNLRDVGLTDSYWSLILPQTAQSLAFGVFWMRNFFRSVPAGVIEAARLDGASDWRVLWQILVPLSRPALLTMAMLVFMWTWNEFLLPLVMITDEGKRTAPLGLAFFQSAHTTQYSLLAAASVIVALPVVVLYVFLQRHFISGMLSGAVKG
ncbi:raffinose/stachyose/melibiose transport system permease protein [Streptomyces sp. LBL]|uniref:carbohydrate ABC transporter permease n=1 Tax=Streptomyces sp. LBL TaxID=2940562 RepID=UPI00247324BE|nr:carbohydrate ABC transporter permease [Streptomyces sp. LBL]MDH6622849.1 raffinose/stachyose/melibiose transport system permease protein [Streptomyces sp. LBL]